MAYTYEKQLWKNYPDTTTPITSDRLNHMEDGIYEAAKSGGGDTIPVGSEFDYDGTTVPEGFVQVDDPNTYSSEEVVIGTWFGKKLYRKTVEFTTGSSINTWTVVSELENIDKCVRYYGYADPNENESWTIPNNVDVPYFSVETGTHRIREAHRDASYNSKDCVITFEYTKSTN